MLEALPQGFDFYHLGRIEIGDESPLPDLTGRTGIAYGITGESRGAFVLLIENSLDVSTYAEAGNIIVSRMATHLQERDGLETSISPPQVLSSAGLARLMSQGAERVIRTYLHREGARVILLTAVWLSAITPTSPTSESNSEIFERTANA